VNATNNTFDIFVGNAHYEVRIEPGVYSTFDELNVAIGDALTLVINGIVEIDDVSAEYNARSRMYTFAFRMAVAHVNTTVEIRCFAIKTGSLPVGVTIAGGFSDVHEILGGTPIRTLEEMANSLDGVLAGGENQLRSKYPASLNTLDAIYLHMNTISSGNYMSAGYEVHTADSLRLIESSIFARIPFDSAAFTQEHEVVSYQDTGNDAYQSFMNRPNIETLDVRVTDARGRSLATLSPGQAADGLLGFRMCLRWDLFAALPTQHRNVLEKPPKM
jgi:hypothetical protein